ncbi:MAG: hypothetical protein IPO06_17040 [Leptospiraceae bacterium]|nr:hypothetical protein [Leptospiraceae bacterium]
MQNLNKSNPEIWHHCKERKDKTDFSIDENLVRVLSPSPWQGNSALDLVQDPADIVFY